ncbi:HAD-IB family hydrolase [Idiomarina sp. HP20-50]|uniref:HAD-IB family hydrolase n=1 Tax=Idiomarina sp. HP20-50 TaxID=3070813 RepID=UPI00294B1AE6|nr:HAD-IB family hydrolase [Idiomarina sp. HP20-50]MDV6315332.1 HAD-IB family hydrolase [Idiomarina sp. HP20-50]
MNLALFDFDGTITEQDTYTKFLFYVTPKRRMMITLLVASPFIALYKLGLLKPSKTRPVLSRIVFWNRSAADIRRLARSFSEQYLPGIIRAEALSKIEWHKSQGDEVYVVSASLDPYLSCWCRSLDIKWVCSELEIKNSKLTGRYVSGDCSLENKVSAIKRKVDLSDFKTIYAYGDTVEDMPMLALAHEKYLNWQRVY